MKIVISEPIYLTEKYKSRLKALGDIDTYDSMPASEDEFIKRIKDAEIVIAGRYGFTGESIRKAPGLRMIALWQTGYDNVDLKAATGQGIVVSNVPDYAFDSVAEYAFALMLNLLRKVDKADKELHRGMFDWRRYMGSELLNKTIGVLGLGDIGNRVVQIAHGFNMNVLAVTAHPSPERAKALGLEFVDLDTLLARSDIVTLHLPLTSKTEHMIGAREIARMKPTAILINTARGKIVDERALISALKEKRIAGAGLDVFETEPLPMDSPLMELDNVVLTPHIAFLTRESVDDCTRVTVENVEMFIRGRPQNVVNRAVIAERGQESVA
ncbi:glycerate dehydrogenase [Methanocella sp. CWC-04]|uniref:Glycerate dehydrogenase n=1 Tax=Methanooceanicella nereidis TaxID=2052831 RepID=A0AAP2W5R0_9EURY|nr:phosphoglycerate dehydrogenase [Methanocella sp. CWC-04]MCD1294372.1 glycerate dehydrogenase [Methanocella sp. CWC-04]